MKPKVSLIIPSWNGLELLKISLPSITLQSFKDIEVIIVDNGSKDGSVEYVENKFPQFRLVKLSSNTGFSPAVNTGIQKALGKYIVLINNDTKLDKNCVQFLVDAADEHPEAGFVAAKMLKFSNPKKIDSAGDFIDTVGHASNIGLDEDNGMKFNSPGYVFLASGGGCLLKKDMLNQVGLFDEDYFAYFEDVDLMLRAQMKGFKGWYQPKAVIYHIHKATSSKNPNFLEFLQYRNMMQTIIKDFPAGVLFYKLNFLKIILVNINTFRYLTCKGYFFSALKAQWYIISHFGKLLQKRKTIQQEKKVSDKYILENMVEKKIKLPLLGRI